ncbi:hypothetical protein OGATHE_005065 [Ogataea polymorpha]|uniref:Uncharacterized protein n=1 Tax=Ogataea polymorpha TaxID=460523 RepID=A0A9P8NVQ2_9ASCO|nr:hypothetical protein OGATHE_005065 [Ogataea polymorpha]
MPIPIPIPAICAGIAVSAVLYVHREEIAEFFEDLAVDLLEKIERKRDKRMRAKAECLGESATVFDDSTAVRRRRVSDWINDQKENGSDTESVETPSRTASSI